METVDIRVAIILAVWVILASIYAIAHDVRISRLEKRFEEERINAIHSDIRTLADTMREERDRRNR